MIDIERWTWRSFIWHFAWGVVVAMTGAALTNYVVDPFDVFDPAPVRRSMSENLAYTKVEHILGDPTRYDAFFLGSSRMGIFDPEMLRHVNGQFNFYNLSSPSCRPIQILDTLRALKGAGVRVRAALIGIDLFPFWQSETFNPGLRPHPRVGGESPMRFFVANLFAATPVAVLAKVMHNYQPEPTVEFDITGGGATRYTGLRAERLRDPELFVARHFPKRPLERPVILALREARFEVLGQVRAWCNAESIWCEFFIHPMSVSDRVSTSHASIEQFVTLTRRALPDVKDFLTDARFLSMQDNQRYFDPSHYDEQVAGDIVESIYAGQSSAANLVASVLGVPVSVRGW